MSRGPDPEDAHAFAPAALPALRRGVDDLSWLLERGYSDVAALKLVGDHLQLTRRQRKAIQRCACADTQVQERRARRLSRPDGPVIIDGFNVLITLERALAGGPVLVGRDGAWRDLAGVHGTWRSVATTGHALEAVGRVLGQTQTTWVLDRPVSNAGRLSVRIRTLAQERGWPWLATVEDQADAIVRDFDGTAATSDGGILDRCGAWIAIEPLALTAVGHAAWRVEL